MKRFAVLVAAAAMVTTTPAAANGLRAAPNHRVRAGLAINWAGYVAHGGPFTNASTTWTEPSISCGASEHSAVAFFAAIDGAPSPTVEQIGTLTRCNKGPVRHKVFWEMYPKAANIVSKRVRAGDSLTATVVASSSTFTLTLVNHTQGWTYSTQATNSNAQLASAEAIVEAPTASGGRVIPLSNFGQVNFSGTTANGQAIANYNPEAVTMVTPGGTTKATPSGLSGGSFSVVWHHA
jgi:hypothetical protein